MEDAGEGFSEVNRDQQGVRRIDDPGQHTVRGADRDNDIAQGKTAEQVFADFKEFVTTVRGKLPGVRIDFIAIKPSIKRWGMVGTMREANRLISEYTRQEEGLGYIDIFAPMLGADGMPRKELFVEDGLHLNDEGYRLWTKIVGGHLDGDGESDGR